MDIHRRHQVNSLNILIGVKLGVLGLIRHADESFYAEDFQALVTRWDKYINAVGDCVNK